MRIEAVDERWRTVGTDFASQATLDPKLKILDKTKDVVVVMGSGDYCTLSDALTSVMLGFSKPTDDVLSFDPAYLFRVPTTTSVGHRKLEQYKSQFKSFPRISIYPGGFYSDEALMIFERLKKPLNVLAVCPEGGLDSVKDNFRDLSRLVHQGVIRQISIFDPIQYDYGYISEKDNVVVDQRPIKVSASTPESPLFFGGNEIWLTRIFAKK